jgi:hypothetical protein
MMNLSQSQCAAGQLGLAICNRSVFIFGRALQLNRHYTIRFISRNDVQH